MQPVDHRRRQRRFRDVHRHAQFTRTGRWHGGDARKLAHRAGGVSANDHGTRRAIDGNLHGHDQRSVSSLQRARLRCDHHRVGQRHDAQRHGERDRATEAGRFFQRRAGGLTSAMGRVDVRRHRAHRRRARNPLQLFAPARHRVRHLHVPAGMQPRLPTSAAGRNHVQRLLRHQRSERGFDQSELHRQRRPRARVDRSRSPRRASAGSGTGRPRDERRELRLFILSPRRRHHVSDRRHQRPLRRGDVLCAED